MTYNEMLVGLHDRHAHGAARKLWERGTATVKLDPRNGFFIEYEDGERRKYLPNEDEKHAADWKFVS